MKMLFIVNYLVHFGKVRVLHRQESTSLLRIESYKCKNFKAQYISRKIIDMTMFLNLLRISTTDYLHQVCKCEKRHQAYIMT